MALDEYLPTVKYKSSSRANEIWREEKTFEKLFALTKIYLIRYIYIILRFNGLDLNIYTSNSRGKDISA